MKNHKFRGKTLSGKWAYGSLITLDTGSVIMTNSIVMVDEDLTEKDCLVFDRSEIEIVVPETVGQFWCTVNNQDLYDGDIFTVNGRYPKLIRWIETKGRFCMANVSELDYDWMDVWQQPLLDWFNDFNREIKIIGNEFDNPELLK